MSMAKIITGAITVTLITVGAFYAGKSDPKTTKVVEDKEAPIAGLEGSLPWGTRVFRDVVNHNICYAVVFGNGTALSCLPMRGE